MPQGLHRDWVWLDFMACDSGVMGGGQENGFINNEDGGEGFEIAVCLHILGIM